MKMRATRGMFVTRSAYRAELLAVERGMCQKWQEGCLGIVFVFPLDSGHGRSISTVRRVPVDAVLPQRSLRLGRDTASAFASNPSCCP
jgi:hypothetical protein